MHGQRKICCGARQRDQVARQGTKVLVHITFDAQKYIALYHAEALGSHVGTCIKLKTTLEQPHWCEQKAHLASEPGLVQQLGKRNVQPDGSRQLSTVTGSLQQVDSSAQ